MKPRGRSLARDAGLEAGRLNLAAGLNPYPMGSLRFEIWQSARLEALARRCSKDELREQCHRQQDISLTRVTSEDLERAFENAEHRHNWR